MQEVKYPITQEGIVSRETFLAKINDYNFAHLMKHKNSKKDPHVYLNAPAAFDIETTSFYYYGPQVINEIEYRTLEKEIQEKYKPGATMYEWTFGLCGLVTTGRTWPEYFEFIDKLHEVLNEQANRVYGKTLSIDKTKCRLVVYIHNEAYEFQFFRRWLKWGEVFSIKRRTPCRALTLDRQTEYRCSYILTGRSLESLAEKCKKYKCSKKVGDLDYKLFRHYLTPLTPEEWGYCEADVRVVMNYIQEQIEKGENLESIPMTKTGYVRRDVRDKCFKSKEFVQIIKQLRLKPEEYTMAKQAFQGGFTHGNAHRISGTTDKKGRGEFTNVHSQDFTSAYPSVLVCRYFPMSRGRKENVKNMTLETFHKLLKTRCCLIDVTFKELTEYTTQDHYISKSRCEKNHVTIDEKGREHKDVDCEEDNGRVVSGRNIRMILTELDYKIICATYRGAWVGDEQQAVEEDGNVKINRLYTYKRGRLPKQLIRVIMEYYVGKTTLKGVKGKEEDYQFLKEMLNSIYGMMVTDIVRDILGYSDDWLPVEKADLDKEINKYNYNETRFTFYLWGVWVTSHVRRNLWTGIVTLGGDYLYADTDSLKYLNAEKHKEYFEKFNANIDKAMQSAMIYAGLPIDAYKPKTVKGEEKPLGYWDDEGEYKRFKTLGAKRYIVEKKNAINIKGTYYDISITVAGVNKYTAVPWLVKTFSDPFKAFENELIVPYEACGKLQHIYCDDEIKLTLTDYKGQPAEIYEKSAVHLSDAQYSLGISETFTNYLDALLGFYEEG